VNRRKFVKNSTLLAAAAMAARSAGGAQPIVGQRRTRASRLFARTSAEVLANQIQGILAADDAIICLHGDVRKRAWTLTAVRPSGAAIWEYPLPLGYYVGLGGSKDLVLINALSFRDTTSGVIRHNSIIQLEPQSGKVSLLGSIESAGRNHGTFFTGGSVLLRLGRDHAELWSGIENAKPEVVATVRPAVPFPDTANVDVLSPEWVAVTARDGTSLWAISTLDGTLMEHRLGGPEISAAQAIAQRLRDESGIHPNRLASFDILPATGADKMLELVVGLVFPVPSGEVVPVILIGMNGVVTQYGFSIGDYRPGTIPIRILRYGGELGIVYGDASVSWYPSA